MAATTSARERKLYPNVLNVFETDGGRCVIGVHGLTDVLVLVEDMDFGNVAGVVVLLGSLGSDRSMWDAQVRDLARDHMVIAVDHRGHVPPETTARVRGGVVPSTGSSSTVEVSARA